MPFVHHTIPGLNVKSYVEWIHIPYTRWFPSPVKRNDAVVFNFPANDTLINIEPDFGSQTTYYQEIMMEQDRHNPAISYEKAREIVWENYKGKIITRPVDKRENFIKRCVAIAGDTIQIINGDLFINGQPQDYFPQAQRLYQIKDPSKTPPDPDVLEGLGIHVRVDQQDIQQDRWGRGYQLVNITNEEVKNMPEATKALFVHYNYPHEQSLFPYYRDADSLHMWSADNYGKLWIPKKGAAIELTADNIIRYRRCIETYENNKLEQRDGKVFINGKEATTYTFKMDYFWLMGDNRHNSLDSRYWGFVPEDHVVGKASLIWFSWEGGPRWKRIFRWIK